MVITLPPLPRDLAPIGCPPVAETLPAAIQRIVEAIQPEKIILFGSYARGNPTPDSDVDLLIVWDTEKPRRERVVEISLLFSPRPFPLDLLVMTPEEIERAREENFFIAEILEQGILLYEQPQ